MPISIRTSNRPAIAALLLMMIGAWARPVRAQTEAPGGQPPRATHLPDIAAPRQVAIGALTLGGVGALSGVLLEGAHHDSRAAYGLVGLSLLTPTLIGLAVCGVGDSKDYEGRCSDAVGGAYMGGVLGAIPAALIGRLVWGPGYADDGVSPPQLGVIIGAALGWAVGSVVGATVSWNRSKRPRSGTLHAILF